MNSKLQSILLFSSCVIALWLLCLPAAAGSPSAPDRAAGDETYTVYFNNSLGWQTVDVYIWDESSGQVIKYTGEWPGQQMRYDPAKKLFSYSVNAPASNPNLKVIFNNGTSGGANQTANLDLQNRFVYNYDGPICHIDQYKPGVDPDPDPDPTSPLGAVKSYSVSDGTLAVNSANGRLFITPFGKEIVKVFTLTNGDNSTERRSISVVPNTFAGEFSVSDSDADIILEIHGGTSVTIDKATSLLSFYDNDKLMLAEKEGLQNKSGNRTVSFRAMNDDAFYGGGYSGTLNWDGRSMIMRNTQTGGWPDQKNYPHNICVPYYVSTTGYGILFDDHYLDARIKPSSKDGTSYSSRAEKPIAYYYCGGGSMERAMQNYIDLTGHQDLPPYWALGYITSKYSFQSENEATSAIDKTRNLGIPVDALIFDIHWQGGTQGGAYGMGALEWNSNGYSNGDRIISNLAAKGVKTICITEPYFNSQGPASDNYNLLKSKGWLADEQVSDNSNMSWIGKGAPVGLIDVHNPEAMEWFADKYKSKTKAGMAGWWLDLGEPEAHDGDSHHSGATYNEARNEYGNVWIEGVYNMLKRNFPDQRHLLLPRAGTAGMQRFSTFPWTGDIMRSWNGLAAQVPALVSASMSGIGYLGSDIGGFISTGTNADLYLRWVQLGVFYPMMRTHSQDRPEPFNSEYRDVQADVKKFIKMRYSWMPYTYTLSYDYTVHGRPLARPANFADADKRRLADVSDAYLWGRDIYVAPMLCSGSSRTVKFPESDDWLDLNTFEIHKAGSATTVSAPLGTLPHFLRRGAFAVRYADDSNYINSDAIDKTRYTVDYFINNRTEPASSFWYDDDHTSPDAIEREDYLLTKLEGSLSANSLFMGMSRMGKGYNGMPANHSMLFRIYGYTPDDVTLCGAVADEGTAAGISGNSSLHAASGNVRYLPRRNTLAEVENATEECYAISDGKAYFRINADPRRNYSFGIVTEDVTVGIQTPADLGAMALEYVDGKIGYSLPNGSERAAIEVYSVTGTRVAAYGDLEADGYKHQFAAALPQGVYVIRLTASNALGEQTVRTVKALCN